MIFHSQSLRRTGVLLGLLETLKVFGEYIEQVKNVLRTQQWVFQKLCSQLDLEAQNSSNQ